MPRRTLKLALLSLLLCLCGSVAVACTCVQMSVEQMYFHADYVVVGRVTSVSERKWFFEESGRGVAVTFEVEQELKGRSTAPKKVKSGYGSWDCSVEFIVGRSYVFFVPKDGRVSYCSGTQEFGKHWPPSEELMKKLIELRSHAK